ncbi:MAG: acetyltransferase, family [Cyanobacteria bacterium RYN_339]|nr:acetyltransferase, family [Cyanobacteria bacterium RYN_339]
MNIRAVRFKDLEAVREIFVSAFREEYGRRGVDIGAQVSRWKKMYPLIRVLGTFPNPYRYMLNLQVCDDEGMIRGFIQTSPGNSERTRWHIDYVAVHPESQGRGIGVKLVENVFDRYGVRGVKSFTLEVDAVNAPALRLYEKLGFRQYATVTYMQLEKPPEVKGLPIPGLRPYQGSDAQGLFELYLACTPAPVRLVDTRKPGDFAVGFVERTMADMRRRMKHVADERFVVEHDGKVVAFMRVMAQMRALPHTIHLTMNPGFEHLYQPLLDHAAAVLAGYPTNPVLSWAPDYQPSKLKALQEWGMQTLTVDRCLVRDTMIALKLPVKEGVSVADDKAFKPAYTQKI